MVPGNIFFGVRSPAVSLLANTIRYPLRPFVLLLVYAAPGPSVLLLVYAALRPAASLYYYWHMRHHVRPCCCIIVRVRSAAPVRIVVGVHGAAPDRIIVGLTRQGQRAGGPRRGVSLCRCVLIGGC